VLALLLLLLASTSHATPALPQAGAQESALLDAINHERTSAGLPALQWDAALATSARQHAQLMAQKNTLSHQFPGELSLQDRATQNGAHFSVISENIAQGPSVMGLHTQWMNSPPHRANILDSEVNSVGIAIVQSGNSLFAVEDFSSAVGNLSLAEQEKQVTALLAARGLHQVTATPEARKTCTWDHGSVGPKPLLVLHIEATDLKHLPPDVEQKIQPDKYHSATIGACDAAGFAGFRIAILLFP
jgi:Cysteine-rich secretory protein family